MESYDWKSTLKLNIQSLKIMGLWPHNLTYKLNLYVMCTFFLYTSFIICHVFFQAINIYFMRDNLSAVVGIIYILLIKILSGFKGYYLIKNMGLLKQVLEILDDDIFRPKTPNQEEIIKSNVRFWKFVRMLYVSTCYGSNLFFGIYPLFDKSSEERRLPFLAWYPFDSKVSPFYEITYTYQMFAVVYNTSVHIHVDSLICVFNVYASCQFEILTDSLKNFGKESEKFAGENSTMLVKCIKHHKSILEYDWT
ncbi:odorant receptor Or1-like [Zophobas morio]|uniref:odorant receptor Or1-like n=1 Tax=Zophobas morio TaxID=2755281 RepID=UPI003082D3EE